MGGFHSLSPQLIGIVRFRLDLFVAFTVLLNSTSGRDASHMCLISLSPRHMCTTTTHVGPKNLTTLAHFIMSSRPMPRRKKWSRMDKESTNSLETLPRMILLSASQTPRGKNSMQAKAASQSAPRRRTSTVGYPWAYGVGTIQGETVISALNAPN